jgi:pyruvate formate lyase activating enzyme
MTVKEAYLYERLPQELVKCKVCPRMCVIKKGSRGTCKTRENRDGKLYTLIYGELTAMNVDPIEKKPLFNFWPGSLSFSISTLSCSFNCPWCQNWNISRGVPGEVPTEYVESEKIARLAKRYNCRSISYTYNEPIIWFEYVLDTAKIAKREGILNVLVTNGYISEEALDELFPYIDAANIDLKGFNKEFYLKYCGADLDGVLNATKSMVKKGIHVETTNLIIPTLNDNFNEIRSLSKWILNELGPDVPLHFSQFYPMYKMTYLEATPLSTLAKARGIALEEGLHYVYTGNIPGDIGENTYCPHCKELLVERWGFEILKWNLTDGMICPKCKTKIAIKGKYERTKKDYSFEATI